jgi:glycosyltransferase involved in cell wall biosynthesis
MRIAQIAPLIESVPPAGYGGTERIVSYLTEQLVALGHDVTLFATADSRTSARLIPCADRALRLDETAETPIPHSLVMLERVRRRAGEFDLMHFHIDLLHNPIFRDMGRRTLTTLHGRLDLPDLLPFYREFSEMPLVSISDAQRAPMPPVAWAGTVHHGIPAALYRPVPSPTADYLAFLGRISPEKRLDRAIQIALGAGLPLKIAAKIDKVDREYHRQIGSLLEHPQVTYIGELDDESKEQFLGNARALLFPIDWPEPFGLVMIEAMACGTPVIAYPCGAVPEILEQGVTGFIVDAVDAGIAAVSAASKLDRSRIRQRFERRFTVERMAQDYLAIYRRILEEPMAMTRPQGSSPRYHNLRPDPSSNPLRSRVE